VIFATVLGLSDSHEAEISRATWDEFAREDAMWYVVAWPEKRGVWNADDFYATGDDSVRLFLQYLPLGGTIVEVGCGLGRMTFALARHFTRVIGIDVSAEMIKRAEDWKIKSGTDNVEFHVNDGRTLPIESGSADACVSYLVLQHMPNRYLVNSYIKEMGRVLRPGGRAVIQLPLIPSTAKGRALYAVRRMIDVFEIMRDKTLRRHPTVRSRAFRGVRLSENGFRRAVSLAGLDVEILTDTRRSWSDCYYTFASLHRPT
jgi:SAM-dependent methyltransferase